MGDTIVRLYQKQNFVIGEDLLKTIRKNNLTLDEALLIIYFCGNNHPILDINEIKQKFGMDDFSVMQAFANITNKNLISIKMEKNMDGKVEELIDLTPFYESIAMDIGTKENVKKSESVFELFEKVFGRPISSTEVELINRWLDKGFDEGLIDSALKQATINNSYNIRYVDAILTEWVKKGFKTSADVEIHLKRNNKKEERPYEDLFDYDWLEDAA